MKNLVLSLLCMSVFALSAYGQGIAINTTGASAHNSAMLDVQSTDKGVLVPRMTQAQRTAITAPAEGLLVYQTNGSSDDIGFWYYDASIPAWVKLGLGWKLTGNAGTVDGTNFLGTTDNVPMNFRANNQKSGRIGLAGDASTFFGYQAGNSDNYSDNQNSAFGYQALFQNITGERNTAIGWNALRNNTANQNTAVGQAALQLNTTGTDNVAVGQSALTDNTTGNQNTAVGQSAMSKNTTGNNNVAVGQSALVKNISGNRNVAIGQSALADNIIGNDNLAIGQSALKSNTNGNNNVAIGQSALFANTIGNHNLAIGQSALANNTTGNQNIAIGQSAMNQNTTGNNNIGIGQSALFKNAGGASNTAVGQVALRENINGSQNTAVGASALYDNTGNDNTAIGQAAARYNTTGTNNTAIGQGALTNNKTGNGNVAIGKSAGSGAMNVNFTQCTFVGATSTPTVDRTNVTMLGYGITDGECTGDNQVLLGNTAVSQIRAQQGSITTYSDKRFKNNIAEDVKGLDFIRRLRPVSYNKNPEILHQIWGTPDSLLKKIDHSQIKTVRFTGLIAQEVEQAMKESGYTSFTGIDIPKNDKQVYSLRYTDFIMPLIKSVQEQQDLIEKQQELIELLQARMQSLEERNQQLEGALRSELQRIKATVEQIKSETSPRIAAH